MFECKLLNLPKESAWGDGASSCVCRGYACRHGMTLWADSWKLEKNIILRGQGGYPHVFELCIPCDRSQFLLFRTFFGMKKYCSYPVQELLEKTWVFDFTCILIANLKLLNFQSQISPKRISS